MLLLRSTEPRCRSAGFTLLEVMVALAIVGPLGLGLMASFAAHLRASGEAAERLEMAAVADEVAARLELLTAAELGAASQQTEPNDAPLAPYVWRADLSPAGEQRGLVSVDIIVSSGTRRMHLTTRFFRRAALRTRP